MVQDGTAVSVPGEDVQLFDESIPTLVGDNPGGDPRRYSHVANERSKLRENGIHRLRLHLDDSPPAKADVLAVPRRVSFHNAGDVQINQARLHTGGHRGVVSYTMPDGLNERLAVGQDEAVHVVTAMMGCSVEDFTTFSEQAGLMESERTVWVLGSWDRISPLEQLSCKF